MERDGCDRLVSVFVANRGHCKLRLLPILHHDVLIECDLVSRQYLLLSASFLSLVRRVPTTMVRCVSFDIA